MAERVLGSGEEVRDCFVLRVKRRREEDPTEALGWKSVEK